MNDVLNLLGLCNRANKIVSGEEMVLGKIRTNKVYLVFLASDTGKNTTKRITDKSNFYKIRLVNQYSTEELNRAIGKSNRKVVAVADQNFAKLILKKLDI